jgi:hypothetical protein
MIEKTCSSSGIASDFWVDEQIDDFCLKIANNLQKEGDESCLNRKKSILCSAVNSTGNSK